jgi:predicted membrane protein
MSRRSPQQRLVFGFILAFLGFIFLLDNFHVFDARAVLAFWPVAFIAVGGLKLAQARHPGGYIVGGVMVATGVLLTLGHMGIIEMRWRDWWPVLLIVLGISVIFKGQLRQSGQFNPDGSRRLTSQDPMVDLTVVMGGTQLKVDAQDFRGGEVNAVMGGVELDFRNASMVNEASLHVFVVMGGVDIKIPPDWTVVVNGIPLLAAIEDKSVPPATPTKRLLITGYLVMGGVEIKN